MDRRQVLIFIGIFVVVGILSLMLAHLDAADREARMAWLKDNRCLRTAYHGDSLRGIWTCPDGQAYMLRDVPLDSSHR